jgi:hypothetical protein
MWTVLLILALVLALVLLIAIGVLVVLFGPPTGLWK